MVHFQKSLKNPLNLEKKWLSYLDDLQIEKN